MPCMYEDIYRISTGENLKTEDWKIPAEEYERIMTTYFPVSIEQLREYCGYDEGSNSYEYEMIYASPYPPFGEVVDYTKNADGSREFRTFLIRDSKNGNTRKKDGSAMSCVCQSRQRLVKLWMEAA